MVARSSFGVRDCVECALPVCKGVACLPGEHKPSRTGEPGSSEAEEESVEMGLIRAYWGKWRGWLVLVGVSENNIAWKHDKGH